MLACMHVLRERRQAESVSRRANMSERVFTLAEICKVCPFVYGIFGIALAVEAVRREREGEEGSGG